MKSLLTLWLSPTTREIREKSFLCPATKNDTTIRCISAATGSQVVDESATPRSIGEITPGLCGASAPTRGTRLQQLFSTLYRSCSVRLGKATHCLPTTTFTIACARHVLRLRRSNTFSINRYFGPLFNTKGRYAFVVVRLRPDHTAEAGNRVYSIWHAIDR